VIAGIVLAAGRSLRMGRPKLTLPMMDGRPMLVHAIESLRQGGVDPIVVVTAASSGVAEAARRSREVTMVEIADEGPMLRSVQTGVRALEESPAEAALILPGDMPFVRATTVRRLVDVLNTVRPRIVAPSFARHRGHPVGLARGVWGDLLAIAPPLSMRDYLRDHSGEIVYVVVDDPGVVADVDRPEDYQRATGRDGG
jgi:molybdenum cofactor cytidylyltransferase